MALLLAAAEAGNADGQSTWGLKVMTAAFETGDNRLVPRAVIMLERAADGGKAMAQSTLGSLVYFFGIGGLKADSVKAVRYLRMGAAQGEPISMYTLGNLMVNGDPWTGQNRAEGWPLIERAAQAGNGRALWRLGLAKMQGSSGQRVDTDGGARLIRQSAAAGDREGMFVLANMLYSGQAVTQDKPEGIRYARLAANAEHGGALRMLAMMSYFGDVGIPRSLEEAARLARRSADTGTPGAQLMYGQLLWAGEGVPQDRVAAVRLFQRAAAQGDEDAIKTMAETDVQAVLRSMKE
jgi:TPR repeat protein